MAKILSPGTKAPDFTLNVTPDQTLSLSELRGNPVILAFYPEDWSPVCSDELTVFNELLPEFRKYQAQLLGISVDSYWCHTALCRHNHFHFQLLSDFEPKGAVAKQYGSYRDKAGTCERSLFVIDKDGVIAWSFLSPVGENPGADGVLEALENLTQHKSFSK